MIIKRWLSPDAQPIAHHPPRPRIDLNARTPEPPAVARPGDGWDQWARDAEHRRIWKLIEQAAQGGGAE
jgi:hypothetical protein